MSTTASPQPEAEVLAPKKRSRFKTIVISTVGALAVLVAGVLIAASTKPDTCRIERSMTINAPAETIYPLIEDYQSFISWSPFEKNDPDMKRTFSGPAAGLGSVYEFDGNTQAGKGRIEITKAVPASLVVMSLDFERPFECHNTVEFTLTPQRDSTKVTWLMHGPNHFMGKVMQVL
jgi:uncharacterized protein YndB with AHSA1/START domain